MGCIKSKKKKEESELIFDEAVRPKLTNKDKKNISRIWNALQKDGKDIQLISNAFLRVLEENPQLVKMFYRDSVVIAEFTPQWVDQEWFKVVVFIIKHGTDYIINELRNEAVLENYLIRLQAVDKRLGKIQTSHLKTMIYSVDEEMWSLLPRKYQKKMKKSWKKFWIFLYYTLDTTMVDHEESCSVSSVESTHSKVLPHLTFKSIAFYLPATKRTTTTRA